MEFLSLGVVGTTQKEGERRLPLHPEHFDAISEPVRKRMLFERGYGEPFGLADADIEKRFLGVADRAEVLSGTAVALLPTPIADDLRQVGEGGIIWGWPHCVQQRETTQVAIDRRLTFVAWESMHTWKRGARDLHLFHRNNEMAGYCAIQHAFGLAGIDGSYGPPLKAVVLSLGAVSRGALHALRGRGVRDIVVYTRRHPWAVGDEVPGCRYGRMFPDEGSGDVIIEDPDGGYRHLIEALAEADVIVNGTLQDTDHPFMYLSEGEERHLKPGSLIVDVSCDAKMGFPFARPTCVNEPIVPVGPVAYYAVDHTPSFLWKSASWEISRVIVPYLPVVMGGPEAWARDETIRRAIEIRDGVVRNRKILAFQRRAEEYPHVSATEARSA